MTATLLRPHAEQRYADELSALEACDERARPANWRLSPWAVVTYLMGGTLADGTVITPKYVGNRRLMEIAVATLATDRALLLIGLPGTAKSWVSEHLAAAVCGTSTLLVRARPRKPCAMDGTTPVSWPRGPPNGPWSPPPSWRPWDRGASPASRSSPACPPTSRTP